MQDVVRMQKKEHLAIVFGNMLTVKVINLYFFI